jgi:hypothetical protein
MARPAGSEPTVSAPAVSGSTLTQEKIEFHRDRAVPVSDNRAGVIDRISYRES